MSKLFRALLVSAVATGAAAVVLKLIEPEAPPVPSKATGPYVDADALPKEQRDALLQELDAQI